MKPDKALDESFSFLNLLNVSKFYWNMTIRFQDMAYGHYSSGTLRINKDEIDDNFNGNIKVNNSPAERTMNYANCTDKESYMYSIFAL